ncbi:MAG: hypothetical protein IIC35_07600 [Gemmatimonadetes bacterium]|nr:hypothetical protein [Gemmatimonadota bacterium]
MSRPDAPMIPLLVAVATVACGTTPTDPLVSEVASVSTEIGPQSGSPANINGGLTNQSAEADSAWFFNTPTGYVSRYSGEQAHSGDRSIELGAATHGGPGIFGYTGQRIEVGDLTGVKLVLTAYIKLENVVGQGVSLALRGDDPNQSWGSAEVFSTTQRKIDISGSGDWAEFSVELQGIDSSIGIITAYVVFLPETTGTVFVDDVRITASEEAPVLSLQNGSFEDGDLRPEYWWRGGLGTAGFVFEWSSTDGWAGDRSVSISRSSESEADFVYWAQTLRGDDFLGGPVTLTARVRGNLSGQGASIVIRGDDTAQPSENANAFVTTQGTVSITGSFDWTEYAVTLDFLPTDMKSITVYLLFLPGTTGTVDFDGVELVH